MRVYWWRGFCAGLLLVSYPLGSAAGPAAHLAQAPTRQVVLLQSSERGNLVLDRFTALLRAQLSEDAAEPLTLTEVVVNPAGFSDSPDQAMIHFLRSAFIGRPKPDLVITTGGAAAAFFRRHRTQLFPGSPILYASLDQRWLSGFTDRETGAAVALDPTGTIADIARLLPATENVFVVVGGGALGRFWRTVLGRESSQFRDRLRFIWPDGISYTAMLQQASTLPARSVIFFTSTYEVDGDGATYSSARVLSDLRARANAPIFGMLSVELGQGAVGGRLIDIDALSRQAADVAVRLLHGESPARIPPSIETPGTPVFDWRELRRWGIDERRLPVGAIVRFREPSLWERYKWILIGTASIVGVQGVLIVALVVSSTKKERAQQALAESEQRFRLLANAAPVMLWMSDTDKRCTDVNATGLEFTGRTLPQELGDGWAEGVHPDDLRQCVDTFSRAFDDREPFRMEYRLRRADGAYRWVLNVGVPRLTPAGSFVGYIGSAIDITEQRAAHAALSGLGGRLIDAQEKERRRLARELHDDIAQRLALVAISLEQPNSDVTPEQLAEQITAIERDLHSLSHRLHSSKLEYLGIVSAAAAFCREASATYSVPIPFEHHGVVDGLSADAALALFRVLQEAVSNAIRHAKASRISVSLRGVPSGVELEVADRGSGFDVVQARQGHGLGLISMEERMKLIGGDLQLRAGTDGTVVRAFAPFTAAADPTAAGWGMTELAG